MRDIEGIEIVLEKLKPHMSSIEAHFNAENERFKALMAQEHETIGRILKCHLIVEHFLDRFLADHFHFQEIESMRLTFFQKASLLPNEGAVAFVKPGILQLNTIRNKFAHRLVFKVDARDMLNINDALEVARRGVKFETLLERVEAFTTLACTFMIVSPPDIQKAFMEAFSAIRVNPDLVARQQ